MVRFAGCGSDAAVKQLILSLDERNRFIIMDLDDTHLLVSPDRVDWLRAELEIEVSIHFPRLCRHQSEWLTFDV